MPNEPIKTRFAPSPTGYLHLGNARTALFNYLLARKDDGVFLLRIEDTDRQRSQPEYDQALQEDLRWLGLVWQEGPGADAQHGPNLQSERGEIYRRHYEILIDGGAAYPCFCSDQELKRIRQAQLAAGRAPRYPGTCATLTETEVRSRLSQGVQPSLRFRVPPDESVEFEDLVRGPQRFATSDIGDFIIQRSDSTPAFFFSNAVDDTLMGITHVLRGEDHLTNTPRQLLVLRALEHDPPAYGHIALLTGGDGSPLSKRRGATSLRELREEGYLPQAISNYLARLGHLYQQTGFLSQETLIEGFDLSHLGRAPARYDGSQLRHWQKEAVAHAPDEELWRWLEHSNYPEGARIHDWVPDDLRIDFVRAVRDNIELPMEASDLAGELFRKLPNYSAQAETIIREAGGAFFQSALAQLPSSTEDFQAYARAVGKVAGVKDRNLFMPLRAALTGETHGPEMARVFPLLGAERAHARLEAALKIATD